MKAKVAVILLAAGASSRMGGVDKLMAAVGQQPMLRHCARMALASQVKKVIVVVSDARPGRIAALAGLQVQLVDNPDWKRGMAGSIRVGVAAVEPGLDAVIIAMADMPDVQPGHFDALIAAYRQDRHDICRAVSFSGKPGHPVLFGRRYFADLAALEGDKGARALLHAAGPLALDVVTEGEGAVTDIDTPEDWQRWRGARP